MCDDWMPVVQLPLTIDDYHRLPRNSAYRYEYLEGGACLTPHAKYYHAVLPLPPASIDRAPDLANGTTIRRLTLDDIVEIERVFCGAFCDRVPFSGLDEPTLRQAAHESLKRTLDGGDGPWLQQASFVA